MHGKSLHFLGEELIIHTSKQYQSFRRHFRPLTRTTLSLAMAL
ncbi:hypothetical protein PanWU01x14_172080 [Parasponia andersonii]|uniref:Uncharacterized protein n=1 Tax=Parasponia andersonii TaxID=3476 RepID=A0A2P5C9B5_PARAD|nr:hypothetical protein PanWU01x14_172080 [Parasponia andersonii]